MLTIALAVLGGLVVLVLSGLRNQARLLRDWDLVLTPWGEEIYSELSERLSGESRMSEYAFKRAFGARAAGSTEEALRFLDVGLRVAERTAPDMVTLLRAMALVSRMAAAVAPVEPLEPRAFRLGALSKLALLGGLLHSLLVSTAERFRLRAYVLRRGFGMATRFLLRGTERVRATRAGSDPEWERIADARADLSTLSTESLQTFHVLLLSFGAERRGA